MQYKWTVLTVTTIGVLMSGIDGRIMIVGLPTVAAALHADAEQAIWFTQAYTIGSTIALLFVGRVSDMFGKVKVYSLGFTLFTIGSILTALSKSPDFFIAARMAQGLGSAALFANSAAIITDAFPAGQLGTAMGVNQIAFRAGAMAGLTISGFILAFLPWPYLFYVNVPIGVFGTIWAMRRLRDIAKPEKVPPMDWIGFVTFTIFIAALLLILTFAAYGMTDLRIVGVLSVVSVVCLGLFVYREHNVEFPLLDLRLLHIKEFMGGNLTQLLNAIAWGGFLLVISLYMQLVLGFDPLKAGIAILPFDVSFLVVGPLSGRLSDKYGTRPFTTAGLAVISLALILTGTSSVSTQYPAIALYLVIGGVGMGLFASPNMSSIMGSLPIHRRSVGSALRATFFNVGYTLSLNVSILIMTLSLPLTQITSIIASLNPAQLPVNERAAFALAIDHVYLIMAVINTAAIVPSIFRGKRSNIIPSEEIDKESRSGEHRETSHDMPHY